ncbi:MAG TPA: thiamine pyrophosphate-dependent dehydrogenase E1 component subunit alpha [Acidobacteriaceae bacterium]|nr:thiamine pyrophosphate-dependent dehydrogenase E1 component subunit alpha [Acidobacteriaceae bacterium]
MATKKAETQSPQKSELKPQNTNGAKSASVSAQTATAANGNNSTPPIGKNPYGIPDWRLEQLPFHIESDWADGEYRYKVVGDTTVPAPPLRPSKYLTKEKTIEIYRYMLINRRMEESLERLYKQSKVIGGLYLSLGQEACSVASAYALGQDDWLAPMIRNQGSMVVKGFRPRDTMMQYMAKGGSPTHGRESGSHYGDHKKLNVVAPISHLGDSISVVAGVALGARLQGKNIACLAFIGDGGQSTGPTYEGFNFAAVQKLGVVLIVEHNLWAYSTPVELQFACKDLADRSIGYGVPGVIIDGTDANQVYDATHEAVQRAYRGEGASFIEAKLMRMKGHAMHDPAVYVPVEVKEYWKRRDPILRMEKYLLEREWATQKQIDAIQSEVEKYMDEERTYAEESPMPDASEVGKDVYCDNAVEIGLKYGPVKVHNANESRKLTESSAPGHYK